MDKGGAIVCDGEFVNASNLKDCAAQLSAEFSIDLNVDIDAHVATRVVTDTANKGSKKVSSFSCTVGDGTSGGDGAFFSAAALGIGLLLKRVSRRGRKG
jgi:hypothetical protein